MLRLENNSNVIQNALIKYKYIILNVNIIYNILTIKIYHIIFFLFFVIYYLTKRIITNISFFTILNI